jgi:hypothetical protein
MDTHLALNEVVLTAVLALVMTAALVNYLVARWLISSSPFLPSFRLHPLAALTTHLPAPVCFYNLPDTSAYPASTAWPF